MIASHPNIVTAILIVIAVFSHVKKDRYSPIQYRLSMNWETGWFSLKEHADSGDLVMYQLFFALKWLVIGAIIPIQLAFG
jgi:hypothetical protein